MHEFNPMEVDFWIKVAYAILCGGLVGIERQVRGKPVGVRTSILICLGTSVFVELGGLLGTGNGDPSRVLGQVVTGVGFLGAGVMLSRGGVVSGVTTAAVIWILAAIGACIGLGYFDAALVFSALTVSVLIGVSLLEAGFRRLRTGIYAEDAEDADKEEDYSD